MGAKTAKRLPTPPSADLARLKQFMVQRMLGKPKTSSQKDSINGTAASTAVSTPKDDVQKPILQSTGTILRNVKPVRRPPAVIGGVPSSGVTRLPAAPRAIEKRLRALVEQQPNLKKRVSPAAERLLLRTRLQAGGRKAKRTGVVWRPPARTRQRGVSAVPAARYGNIHDLRVILKLDPSEKAEEWSNTVFVSLDLEWERRGLISHVVEIGVTTLAVRDIAGLEPRQHLEGWMPHMKHHHFVINTTQSPHTRMNSSLFASSEFLSLEEAREELLSILHECATPDSESDLPTPKLILVGQSIDSDIAVLRRQPLHRLDLLDPTATEVEFASVMDTHRNNEYLVNKCDVKMRAGRLGEIARRLGVHPRYHGNAAVLKGLHDASNDAAYALMALLLQGLKFKELIADKALPMAAGVVERAKLSSTVLQQLSIKEGKSVKVLKRQLRKAAKTELQLERADERVARGARRASIFWTTLLGIGSVIVGVSVVRPHLGSVSGKTDENESEVD